MADKTFDILIDIRTRLQGLEDAQRKIQASTREAQNFNSVLSGFAGGVAGGAFAQLTAQLARIPAGFASAINEGVRFNATLESAKLGVAAIVKQFDTTGKFASFDAALAESGKAIDILKQKAKESPATFEQLVSAFQGVSGAASAANIPLQKQLDLVVLMSQALAGLGIRSDQILQESRALLTGNINEDAMAARILGITKAQVEAAKSQGNLYDFLTEKMSAFAEAGQRGQQTFTTQLSNLEDALTQLKGVATENVFDILKDSLSGLNATLNEQDTAEKVRGISNAIVGTGSGVASIFDTALKSLQAFGAFYQSGFEQIGLDHGAAMRALFEDLYDTGNARQFVIEAGKIETALVNQAQAARTAKEEEAARRVIDEAIAALQEKVSRSTGETQKYAQEYLSRLQQVRGVLPDIVGTSEAAAAATQKMAQAARDAAAALAIARGAANEQAQEELKILNAKLAGNDAEARRLELENLRADKFKSELAKGTSADTAWALAEATMRQAENEDRIKAAKEAASQFDKDSAEAKRQQADAMRDIQSWQSAIAGDPFLSVSDKNAQLIPLLQREAEAHRAAGDAAAAHAAEMQALALTFEGNLQANMQEWLNGFGTSADQVSNVITGTLNAAISQTSRLLTDAIFRTGDWEKALLSVGETGVQMLIEMGLQMVLQNTLGRTLKQQTTAESVSQNATVLASAAPAAAAEGAASWGANWIIGGIAAIAAIAMIAAALGAFHTGGVAGRERGGRRGRSGPLQDDELMAILLKDEVVLTPEQAQDVMIKPGKAGSFTSAQRKTISEVGVTDAGIEPPILAGNDGRGDPMPTWGGAQPWDVTASGGPSIEISPPRGTGRPTVEVPTDRGASIVITPEGRVVPNVGGTAIADFSAGHPWSLGGPVGATTYGSHSPNAAPGASPTLIPTYWGPSGGAGDRSSGVFLAGGNPFNSFAGANTFGSMGSSSFGAYMNQTVAAWNKSKSGGHPSKGTGIYHAGGPIQEVDITAQVGEYMIRKEAADHYGLAMLDSLNNMRMPRETYHEGGAIGGGSGSGAPSASASPAMQPAFYFFTDKDDLVRAIANSPHMQKSVIKTIDGSRMDLGFGPAA